MPRNLSEGNKKDGTGWRLTKSVTLDRRTRGLNGGGRGVRHESQDRTVEQSPAGGWRR